MKNIMTCCVAFLITLPWLQAQTICSNPPVVTINVDDATPCLGQTVTLTASGASTYSWNNNVQNGVSFTPSASETYQVIGTDSAGCKDTNQVLIDVLPLPDLVANSSSLSICQGDSIALTATGAVSYTWVEPTINNGDFYTPTVAGANVFLVEGVGTNGCINTSQVIVVVKDIPDAPVLSNNAISTCLNVPFDASISATVAEGRALWFSDVDLINRVGTEPELAVQNSTAGTQVFYAATFEGGCFSLPEPATVEVFELPQVDAGLNIAITAGERSSLNGQSGEGVEVTWSPEFRLSDPSSLIPQFTATNSERYTLTVVDANGCINSDEVLLNVKEELIIGNVITPNNDGNNDTWKIFPESALSTCTVNLFDGFGRRLLETDNYQNDWDGTFEGGNLPDGDYYYHIQCDGGDEKGTLVIIK